MSNYYRTVAPSAVASARIFGQNLWNLGTGRRSGRKALRATLPHKLKSYWQPPVSAYNIPEYIDPRIEYFQNKHVELYLYEGKKQGKKGQGKQAQLRQKEKDREEQKEIKTKAKFKETKKATKKAIEEAAEKKKQEEMIAKERAKDKERKDTRSREEGTSESFEEEVENH